MESKCSTKKMMKPLFLYFIIWTVSVLVFWLGLNKDAMGYGVLYLYIVLPIATFFSSLMVGRDNSWGAWAWGICLLLGFMHAAAGYMTYDLSNMLMSDKFLLPQLESIPLMTAIAIAGVSAGKTTTRLKSNRGEEEQEPSTQREHKK